MNGIFYKSYDGEVLIGIGLAYSKSLTVNNSRKILFAVRWTDLVYIIPDANLIGLGKVVIVKESEVKITDNDGMNPFVLGNWPIIKPGNYNILVGYDGKIIGELVYCNFYIMRDPDL